MLSQLTFQLANTGGEGFEHLLHEMGAHYGVDLTKIEGLDALLGGSFSALKAKQKATDDLIRHVHRSLASGRTSVKNSQHAVAQEMGAEHQLAMLTDQELQNRVRGVKKLIAETYAVEPDLTPAPTPALRAEDIIAANANVTNATSPLVSNLTADISATVLNGTDTPEANATAPAALVLPAAPPVVGGPGTVNPQTQPTPSVDPAAPALVLPAAPPVVGGPGTVNPQ